MVVSNNPEGVNREGLILSSDAMRPQNSGTVWRMLNNGVLDADCPSGSMKEFTFYMHHLNFMGGNARYYVFLEPARAGERVEFNAYGAAVTQVDTRSLDPGLSPSYAVSYAATVGRLPNHVGSGSGSRMIVDLGKSITAPYAVVNLGAIQNSSVDARFKVRSLNNKCLRVKVVAASAANASLAKAYELAGRQYAWGNANTGYPCWSNGAGWGRPHGFYQYDTWVGEEDLRITSGDINRVIGGHRLVAAPPNITNSRGDCVPAYDAGPIGSGNNQRARGIRYYTSNTSGVTGGGDSDTDSTSNYGVEYRLDYTVANKTNQCLDVKFRLSNYPGQIRCEDASASASRHWDGVFKVQSDSGTQFNRVFTKCPSRPVSTLATQRIGANDTKTLQISTVVPGLISAPAGILVDSCRCGQICPLD